MLCTGLRKGLVSMGRKRESKKVGSKSKLGVASRTILVASSLSFSRLVHVCEREGG